MAIIFNRTDDYHAGEQIAKWIIKNSISMCI